jgi:hypothetical protein
MTTYRAAGVEEADGRRLPKDPRRLMGTTATCDPVRGEEGIDFGLDKGQGKTIDRVLRNPSDDM